ncbi:hypothetical protein FB451DRAFT_1186262 [Mycena latifolia]|nr:hypothetical protein FB451DRAFT_1186262 [Mycena latifolia]
MCQAMEATEVKGRLVEMREDRRREEKRAKQEQTMMKLRLKELKMRNTHELRMAATAAGGSSVSRTFFDMTTSSASRSVFDTTSTSSGSRYPSEPNEYPEFEAFPGNVTPGPLTSGTANFSLTTAEEQFFTEFANSLGTQ